MAFKCQNPYCEYGDGFANSSEPTINADGKRPEYTRANSYSQNKENWQNSMYKGLCLNCIADEDQENRMEGLL